MNSIMAAGKQVFPSKIICIGRNYVGHIQELENEIPEEMVVFLKPNSAISSTLYSQLHEPLHYETEIAFMVEDSQLGYVGVGLDLTKRALQSRLKKKGLPWERAKSFDGAALFSDFVSLKGMDCQLTIERLVVELKINGELRQAGSVAMMMYSPDVILDQLQTFMTLNDGDLVMTGTPAGVGEVVKGALYHASIHVAGEVLVASEWRAE